MSATGLLAFQTGGGTGAGFQLTWFDRMGTPGATIGTRREFQSISFSPDRKTLAASARDLPVGKVDVWTYDVARGLPTRFTFDSANEYEPVWSPDGGTIVFDSNPKGHRDLYKKSANHTGTEELVYSDDLDKRPTSWSPDGKFVIFQAREN